MEKTKGHKKYDEETQLFYQLVYENPEHPILEISGIRSESATNTIDVFPK